MKLKVLKSEDTPKNCVRRIVLKHDENGEWVRDTRDCVFMLWSNSRDRVGDRVWDPVLKRRVEVDSPFEEILDEDGYGTGERRIKEGLIAFPVDVYEHGGTEWALSGEGGVRFSCPWDAAHGAFYLYVDKERWDSLCGDCEWKFADGKPTDELYGAAKRIARAEIEEMNLCERGCYYGYEEQGRVVEESKVKTTKWDGTVETEDRTAEDWDDMDSCWGFLTDKPARDVDFPLGCPVVTDEDYLVGDTFEQECFALSDDVTGKFVRFENRSYRLVGKPKFASLMCRTFLENNRRSYFEENFKRAFTVVDVTERVWKEYPECLA